MPPLPVDGGTLVDCDGTVQGTAGQARAGSTMNAVQYTTGGQRSTNGTIQQTASQARAGPTVDAILYTTGRQGSTNGRNLSTTTISTLAIQSGKTRIVLALLKSGKKLDLKVVEMEPGLVYLGNSFQEAQQLILEQNKLISEIQSKQSPVEDLLRQADSLIINQQPKAEVYACMAESLGKAWKDLNDLLEKRRQILQKNYTTQGHIQDNLDKIGNLKSLCSKLTLQQFNSVEDIKVGIKNLEKARKSLLETSVYSLQEGEGLLGLLHELDSSLDSRPVYLYQAVLASIDQVSDWLENLHDARVEVSDLFTLSMSVMKRKISGFNIMTEIDSLHRLVAFNREMIIKNDSLGSSSTEACQLLEATLQLEREAHTISERSLKCVKLSQVLDVMAENLSMEVSIKAYDVLEQSAEYQLVLDNRKYLLNNAKEYFDVWSSALTSLENIEREVTSLHTNTGEALLKQLIGKTQEVLTKILDEGVMLSEKAGNGPGTRGVRMSMDNIEEVGNRVLVAAGKLLEDLQQANPSGVRLIELSLLEIETWINQLINPDIPSNIDIQTLETYMEALQTLHTEITKKIALLDGLREECSALPSLQEEQKQKYLQKIQRIRVQLIEQRDCVENLKLTGKALRSFIQTSEHLQQEIQTFDLKLLNNDGSPGSNLDCEQSRKLIDELYKQILALAAGLKQGIQDQKICKSSKQSDNLQEALKRTEEQINFITKVVETRLEEFTTSHHLIIEKWTRVEQNAKEKQSFETTMQKLRSDVERILNLVGEMDAEIYPIFKQEFQKSSLLQVGLEERRLKLVRARVLPERIQALSNQIEEFLGGLDSSSSDKQSDGQKLHQELGHSHTQVQMKLEEYETVLNLFSKLLGHISQIETMCTSYQESTRKQGTPRHVQAAKAALQELNDWKLNLESEEKSANKYLEAVFKEVRTLKTNQQFQPDLELLAKLQSQLILAAETLYAEYKTLFTDNLGFCEYTAVQRELCLEIDQLIRLVKTKLLVTENISSVGALDTVLNPLLERISITESKVQEITRKGETLLLTNHGSAVELGQSQLQDKWAGLEALLSEQKQKLASAVLYFSHIEKAENFIKQSTTRILHWSNEVTGQKCIERCNELVKEIEMYIKREKQVQDDNITKMTALAGKIYGNDAILRIKSLHMETNEAFTGIQALRQKFLGLEESLKREKKEEERVRKLKAETDKRIAAAEEAAKTAKIEAEAAAAEKRAVQHLKEKEAAVRRAAAEAEKAAKLKEMNELEQLRRKEKELEIREIKLRNEEELRKKEEEVRIRIEKEELKRKQREEEDKEKRRREEEEEKRRKEKEYAEKKITSETQTETCIEEAPPRPPSPVGDPPPEHVPPVFLHLLQDKVELAGTRCILSVKVSGVPLPIITWFKDGVCVSENKNYISVFKEGVSQLTILETCKEDSANWTIRASNSAGYAESHAKLLVQEKKIEEKTDDSSSKGVRQKPAFYVPLSNCTAGCKQTVVLHCIIAGCPVPAVFWFKDGVKVAEDANISLVQDKDHYRLVLVNTSPKDNGEYKVVATNSEGTSQSSCSLSIISSDLSPSTSVAGTPENAHQAMIKNSYTHSSISQVSETRSSYFSESKNRRREDKEPRFIQPILGCLVEVGARVSFEGIVDGFPSPTLVWKKNGVEVKETQNLIINLFNKKATLTIIRAREEDSGMYSCTASNRSGTAESLADLAVRRKNLSPVFLKRLQSQTLLVGHKLRMEVEIGGTPAPSVTWLFNNTTLQPSDRIQMSHEGLTYYISIKDIQEADSGTYSVKAVNSAGETVSAADIAVFQDEESPPRPPEPKMEELTESDQGFSRSVSPRPHSSTSVREIGSETSTLRTLAAHRRHQRPLPDLLPFPFHAETNTSMPRKNAGKVPKPSKFIKGEMYHSDYESDYESRIPVIWKPCHSDSEEKDFNFRRVQPIIQHPRAKPERKPSPPCPHRWETHDEVDQLEKELKTKKSISARTIRMEKLSQELEKKTTETTFTSQKRESHQNKELPTTEQKNKNKEEILKMNNENLQNQKRSADVPKLSEHSRFLDQKSPVCKKFSYNITNHVNKQVTEQVTEEVRQWASQIYSSEHKINQQEKKEETDKVYYEATTKHSSIIKSPAIVLEACRSMMSTPSEATERTTPPPIPPKQKTSALSPSPVRGVLSPSKSAESETSQSTVQTTIQSTEYIRVREKVKHFEQKVEEDMIRQSLEDYSDYSGSIRPETIPGAVRILPTPTPPGSRPGSRATSRKNSFARSSSTEPGRGSLWSPITTCRSLQQSPCFSRRLSEQPPPMYRPPDTSTDTESVSRLRDISYKVSSGLETSSTCSTLEYSNRGRSSKTYYRSESGLSEDDPPARPPPPIQVYKSDTCSSFRTTTITSPPPLESVSFGERDTTVEPWSGEELKSPGLHLGFRGQPDYTDDDTDLDQNLGDTGFMEDEDNMEKVRKLEKSRSPKLSKSPKLEASRSPKLEKSRSPKLAKQSFSMDGYEADTETLSRRGTISTSATTNHGASHHNIFETASSQQSVENATVNNITISSLSETITKFSETKSIESTTSTSNTNLKRRGSVKQLTAKFQEYEQASSSQIPRPRTPSESGFTVSTAYIAPKWKLSPQALEKGEKKTGEELSRLEQQTISSHQMDNFQSRSTSSHQYLETRNHSVESRNFESSETKSINHSQMCGAAASLQYMQGRTTPVIFKPSKFVPGVKSEFKQEKIGILAADSTADHKIKTKWTPPAASN